MDRHICRIAVNSIFWQFHEAKASIEGVAVHKHHELPTGIVHSKELSGIVATLFPKDTLIVIDEVALLDNFIVSNANYHWNSYYLLRRGNRSFFSDLYHPIKSSLKMWFDWEISTQKGPRVQDHAT